MTRFRALPPGARVLTSGASPAQKPTAQQRLRALGRLPAGQMNKTETAFAAELERRRQAGEVLWWKFEGVKLRLADNCFLTVDFAVLPASGVLTMVDVKGGAAVIQDDSKVKLKVAASTYPFVFAIAIPRPKRDGGGWIEEIL